MPSAYERKKQPEIVRQNLIDCAARIAAERGLADVTVQAVAAAAGVTKGGLLHHYPSKQALIDAVFTELLARLDRRIEASMKADTGGYGAFTRAYIDLSLALEPPSTREPWSALSVFMLSDVGLRKRWRDWLAGHLQRHADTDGDPALRVAHLAADGAWLSDLLHHETIGDRLALRAQLFALVGPPAGA